MKTDPALLRAALVGYEDKLARIDAAISEIRHALEQMGRPAAEGTPRRARRKMTRAARARIAAAQKKRWAEYKKSHSRP